MIHQHQLPSICKQSIFFQFFFFSFQCLYLSFPQNLHLFHFNVCICFFVKICICFIEMVAVFEASEVLLWISQFVLGMHNQRNICQIFSLLFIPTVPLIFPTILYVFRSVRRSFHSISMHRYWSIFCISDFLRDSSFAGNLWVLLLLTNKENIQKMPQSHFCNFWHIN